MFFWTGFACGVVVTVALGVAAWHILSLYDPAQAAGDPLRSPGAGLAYRRRWRRPERSGPPSAYRPTGHILGGVSQRDSDNGHE